MANIVDKTFKSLDYICIILLGKFKYSYNNINTIIIIYCDIFCCENETLRQKHLV